MYKYYTYKLGIPDGLYRKILLIMRLTTVILIASLMQVSAAGFAQKISLSERNTPLMKVFDKIRAQSGVDFVVDGALLKVARPVTIQVKDVELAVVLERVFADQPLEFSIENKMVVVSRKEPSFLENLGARFQAIDVRGRVVDESGVPLVGATVSVKGMNKSVSSDAEGRFFLAGVDEGAVLEISYIGYALREVKGATILGDVVMVLTSSSLDQVQVIGYGTTTKRLSTGNISVVNSETIASQPVTNPLQALAGRVAGLQVTQTSGLPGKDVTVRIRGRNSITANNNPLYIVDGVPFSSDSPNAFFPTSPLNNINPDDIESISVLKDADATAIYGSRAANGVILITTKRGHAGATVVNAKGNTGWSEVSRAPAVMSTPQYLQMRKAALANSGVTATNINAPDLLVWDENTDNKWQDLFMGRTASSTDASLSISGGTTQTTFLISGAYHSENTVQSKQDYFRRGNGHIALNHRSLNDKFHMAANVFYTANNGRLTGLNGLAVGAAPNFPIYNPDGSYNWTSTNYVAQATQYAKTGIGNLNTNLVLDYLIIPGLRLKANLGYNRIENNYLNVLPSTYFDPAVQKTGSSLFSKGYAQTLLFEPQVIYSKQIGSGKLDLLAGATVQSDNRNVQNVSVSGYTNDLLLENPGYGTTSSPSGTNIQYRYLSSFARATYTLADRYIVNGTFRRDGSSRFGENNKFGNFGSVGAAWIFSNEDFIKNAFKILSFGKLRGSYGSTGSDGIGDYQYLSTYAAALNPYGTQQAIKPNNLGNPNYGWEVNRKLEAAIDLGFFGNRILWTGTWYRNRSSSQLVNYALPSMTGFSGYTANLPAAVQNTGWEFELTTENFKNGTFRWTSALNVSIPTNELRSFPNLDKSSYANRFVIGQSLDIVQLYHFTGVDPQTGFATVLDMNGDGNYTPSSSYNNQKGDYQIAGTTSPKWFGGINNTLSYAGLQLDVFFQYTKQQGYNLYVNSGATSMGLLGLNSWTELQNYWKAPGDNTSIPKPVANSVVSQFYYSSSDAGFSDASFLRLKNVMLSYQLPKLFTSKMKITNLKIYAQGQNLWTVTKYKGYDPETSDKNNGLIGIPTLRTVVLGLQAAF